jgi:hypothetical protein
MAEPRANQNPAKTIQIKFKSAVQTPADSDSTSFLPKGQKEKPAILKQAIPNGIPTIVQQHNRPTTIQESPSKMPPKANHSIFPINAI